jgi:hypothetical protein
MTALYVVPNPGRRRDAGRVLARGLLVGLPAAGGVYGYDRWVHAPPVSVPEPVAPPAAEPEVPKEPPRPEPGDPDFEAKRLARSARERKWYERQAAERERERLARIERHKESAERRERLAAELALRTAKPPGWVPNEGRVRA